MILDMDSSESPVHGQQEGAAYNGPRFIGVSAIIPSFYLTSSGIAKERRYDPGTSPAPMAGRNSLSR